MPCDLTFSDPYDYNAGMPMIQRRFYLPEELYARLKIQARLRKTNITQVLRELIAEGLKQRQTKSITTNALLHLANTAETEQWGKSGPRDVAETHDRYFAKAWKKEHHLRTPQKK